MKKQRLYIIAGVIVALLILIGCTFFGSADISFGECCKILLNKIFGLYGEQVNSLGNKATIIWQLRFPRALLAFLVGGCLSVCGAVYQAIFKNAMADPYVLGISSGAAFGATLGMILNIPSTLLGMNIVSVFAFAAAVLTVFLVYNLAKTGRSAHITSLLLSGIAISQFLTAIISLVMLMSAHEMKRIYFWTMGSFSAKGWSQVLTVLPYAVIGCVLICIFSRDLDIIMLGDDSAVRLGVESEKIKKYMFLITAFMMAACVSVSGIIGFVGLIAPHIVRLFSGPKHKWLLPLSFLLGAVLLVVCDTVSRSIIASEIPVGIVTAVIGAPFFIYLLRKKKTEVM